MAIVEAAKTLTEWLDAGRQVAVALLVDVEGSGPLDPGAMLLVNDVGAIEGSLTGGCIEGAVVEEANAVLGGGSARTLTYGVSDELAGTVGLTCGGTVHVLVFKAEPTHAAPMRALVNAIDEGAPAGVATIVDGPRAGAQIVVADGEVHGSLGGPALLEHNVTRDLQGIMDHGGSALSGYGDDGNKADAANRVFLHSFVPAPQMVIFGAADFSAEMAPIAAMAGYEVTICDARSAFTQSPRYSRAAKVITAWPQEVFASRRLGPRDAILVFTHDPKFDEPALLGALNTDAGYIGALGSRRTTENRARRLRDHGVDDAALTRIHAPCGLDIGARTPFETAVAILAEIIASRTGRAGISLRRTAGSIRGDGVRALAA